jgi:3-deoxy-D-manno-octulosonate 8-phosphate phosphatase (KDO 8-P phosphatase)
VRAKAGRKKAARKPKGRGALPIRKAIRRATGAIKSIKREDVVRTATEALTVAKRAAETAGRVAASAGKAAARSRVTGRPIQRARSLLATTLHRLQPRIKPLRLLLLDVDGVLTDGGIVYIEGIGELKRFDIQDGMGVDLLLRAGVQVGILTGRRSEVVERRGRELGMELVKQGFYDKSAGLDEVLVETGLQPEQVGYVGDDVQDLPVLRRVGFRAAPADAAPEVQAEVDYVCATTGGNGAVREVAEVILTALGKLEEVIGAASRAGVTPPPGRGPAAPETDVPVL